MANKGRQKKTKPYVEYGFSTGKFDRFYRIRKSPVLNKGHGSKGMFDDGKRLRVSSNDRLN